MKNQAHLNESFEEIKSEEGESPSSHLSSLKSNQENILKYAQINMQIQSQQFRQNLRLESEQQLLGSRVNQNSHEVKTATQEEQQQHPQQIQRNNTQLDVRIDQKREKQIIKAASSRPDQQNQVTFTKNVQIGNNAPTHFSPHYSLSPIASHIPETQKHTQFKSLDNLRNITQQSFTPSQKTIVLNHISNGGVYYSHVSTERMRMQQNRQPNNTRHSHVNDNRVLSPTRVSFDYAQSKPEGMVVRNVLFNSYIPVSTPINLERTGAISSNAPQPSDRHFNQQDEVNLWREKYEELARHWDAIRIKETKQQEVGLRKFIAIEKNYQLLQSNYNQLVQEYHKKLDQNQMYFQQIQGLQTTINQLQLSPPKNDDQVDRLSRALKQKEQQIKKLNTQLQQLKKDYQQDEYSLQSSLQQKSKHVTMLKQQNQQYQILLKDIEQKYEREMNEMHEHATMLQMEIQQREAQLKQRSLMKNSAMCGSDNSQFAINRSRMESFQNTRVAELQMHIGKLNAELNMREESAQRELKMANLNVAELVDRFKTLAAEKDQAIRNLQEKNGLLESDLNKKDSIIRNFRDEAAANRLSHGPPASVYSSAVNPTDRRMSEEQVFRRQLQDMRRSLFERERQKMILKQKYEELQQKAVECEQALGKKKVQNQSIRRQLNDFDNLQHENDKLMEVLNKKNSELLEMKEMLLEKQQHAGDFENLSMENDRLRNFMVKKNEELSQLAQRLYNEQKRVRQVQLKHSPRIHELQDEIQTLQDTVDRKQIQNNKLKHSLEQAEGNFSEIQFELERLRNINVEYEAIIQANTEKIQNYQEYLDSLEQIKSQNQHEIHTLKQNFQQYHSKFTEKQRSETDALNKIQQLSRELEMRQEELSQIALQHLQLKQFKQKSTKEIQMFECKQGDLQLRCRDLESLLRNREQRLARGEKQLEENREHLKKHHNCSKQIETMTEQISNYQMKILSLTINRSYSGITQYPQPGQVFENRIIYNLKGQNEALREEIGNLKYEYNVFHENKNANNFEKEGNSIKTRLNEFNRNLGNAIGGSGLKRVRSVQTLGLSVKKETKSIIEQQNKQIERLKQLARDMQCQSLQDYSIDHKKQITPQYIDLVYREEIEFYRSKNSELEERVDSLLKVNGELKQKLEDCILHKNSSIKMYYQGEVKRLQKEVNQFKIDKTKSGQLMRGNDKKVSELQQLLEHYKNQNFQSPQKAEVSYNFSIGMRHTALGE